MSSDKHVPFDFSITDRMFEQLANISRQVDEQNVVLDRLKLNMEACERRLDNRYDSDDSDDEREAIMSLEKFSHKNIYFDNRVKSFRYASKFIKTINMKMEKSVILFVLLL